MTKSELIELIARKQTQFSQKDVELAISEIIDSMIESLSNEERIEIRGFGSFTIHYRESRIGRNPKTGATVNLSAKKVPHFKPGKLLRVSINENKDSYDII